MVDNQKRGIGFRFAWDGLKQIISRERNFRIHLHCAIIAVIAGVAFGLSRIEWLLLVVIISLVLAAEMVNTAIEKLLDYLKPEMHPIAKYIKDVSAGAVLIVSVGAFIGGLLLFIPKLIEIIG